MTELSIEELQRTAQAYEDMLVPALFERCARTLADAAAIEPGQEVLDVACGTGVVARTVAERVKPGGFVAGVDINPGMLAVAQGTAPDIEWREASVEELPFDDESFDAVLCQFGMMFFPDPAMALGEMNRVLKSGGRLAVAVFDSLERQPVYGAMADVYERVIDETAGEAGRGPYTMGDTDELAAVFAAAGIDNVTISHCDAKVCFPGVREMVLAEVDGWFPFAGISVDEPTIEVVIGEVERVVRPYQAADGSVEAPIPAHIVTAEKS